MEKTLNKHKFLKLLFSKIAIFVSYFKILTLKFFSYYEIEIFEIFFVLNNKEINKDYYYIKKKYFRSDLPKIKKK